MATVAEKIELLHKKLEHIKAGGGEKRIEKQHAKGKLTARERLAKLFDEGSFVEVGAFVKHRCHNFGQEKKDLPGEGVVTGYGTVDGKLVYAFAQDFTVEGGSLGEKHAAKIVHVQQMALKMGAPFVGLNDSGGAVFRKQLMHYQDMVQFSTITPLHPVLCPRFLQLWDHLQAVRYIPLR